VLELLIINKPFVDGKDWEFLTFPRPFFGLNCRMPFRPAFLICCVLLAWLPVFAQPTCTISFRIINPATGRAYSIPRPDIGPYEPWVYSEYIKKNFPSSSWDTVHAGMITCKDSTFTATLYGSFFKDVELIILLNDQRMRLHFIPDTLLTMKDGPLFSTFRVKFKPQTELTWEGRTDGVSAPDFTAIHNPNLKQQGHAEVYVNDLNGNPVMDARFLIRQEGEEWHPPRKVSGPYTFYTIDSLLNGKLWIKAFNATLESFECETELHNYGLSGLKLELVPPGSHWIYEGANRTYLDHEPDAVGFTIAGNDITKRIPDVVRFLDSLGLVPLSELPCGDWESVRAAWKKNKSGGIPMDSVLKRMEASQLFAGCGPLVRKKYKDDMSVTYATGYCDIGFKESLSRAQVDDLLKGTSFTCVSQNMVTYMWKLKYNGPRNYDMIDDYNKLRDLPGLREMYLDTRSVYHMPAPEPIIPSSITTYTWTPPNAVDSLGRRIGYWQIRGRDKKNTNYKPDELVEEGSYKDGKKTGAWKEYWPGGTLKGEIPYENNRPKGYAKMYNKQGCLQEEGYWMNNRWNKRYILYYPGCGCKKWEFNYNDQGQRHGEQKYYYPGCRNRLMTYGMMKDGKEAGVWMHYDTAGNISDVTVYPLQPAFTKSPGPVPPPSLQPDSLVWQGGHYVLSGNFNGTGYAKIYNNCGLLLKDGYFKDYRLIEGKDLIYDKSCNLVRVAVYKMGIYQDDLSKNDTLFHQLPIKVDSMIPLRKPPSLLTDSLKKIRPPAPTPPCKSGYLKLYNSLKQLSKDGEFKDCKLINGKEYIYDENGILVQVKFFKNGKYVGDAPVEKDR
jgi:antitoxin component YwqK of YwqJK toxin-antitoxin module